MRMRNTTVSTLLSGALILIGGLTADAKIQVLSTDPYRGAIVIDAATGQTLAEDRADTLAYPASVVKLMDLLIILERVQQGGLTLQDKVTVDAAASRMGGSQVYLKEHEVFTVDELLYALVIQSANDAAVALAKHVAGSTEGFVALMNEKAAQLGMKSTRFVSCHGLPPSPGGSARPDLTTARDIATLCRELLKYPDALRYTSTRERKFRETAPEPFIMRSHNKLLFSFEGCDGLKTGYFSAAGFSIAATAKRGDARVIAVVMGSVSKTTRDAKAAELLAKGFLLLPKLPPPVVVPPPATNVVDDAAVPPEEGEEEESDSDETAARWPLFVGGVVTGLVIAGGIAFLRTFTSGGHELPKT